VRLDIFPDGGMARLRLPGQIGPDDLTAMRARWWGSLPAAQARLEDVAASTDDAPG
jgi:allantoicase